MTEVNPPLRTHRLDTSPGTTLAVHEYDPSTEPNGRTVVLVHGLLSSSEIFDVPGLEHPSLARHFARRGFRVFTYDQRGTGDSVAASSDFGLAEHALVDLPTVLDFALERSAIQADRLVVGGHSLGGLLIYVQQIAARGALPGSFGPAVRRVFAVASPASFDPRYRPWNLIARGGHALVRRLDQNGDGMISRNEFVAGQSQLRWPLLGRIVGPGVIRASIRLGVAVPWLSWGLQRAPLPTFIYGRQDFTARGFWWLLQSRALDAASRRLLDEVVDATHREGRVEVRHESGTITLPDDLAGLEDLRVLTMSSRGDALVPPESVRAVHEALPGGRHLLTEEAFGVASGHAGYLFRPGLADPVGETLVTFCEADDE